MADAAALLAAAESDDPFALARLLHPEDVLTRVVHAESGWELVLRIARDKPHAWALDGVTIITPDRKAKAGAGAPATSHGPSSRSEPAPADALPEPRPRVP